MPHERQALNAAPDHKTAEELLRSSPGNPKRTALNPGHTAAAERRSGRRGSPLGKAQHWSPQKDVGDNLGWHSIESGRKKMIGKAQHWSPQKEVGDDLGWHSIRVRAKKDDRGLSGMVQHRVRAKSWTVQGPAPQMQRQDKKIRVQSEFPGGGNYPLFL